MAEHDHTTIIPARARRPTDTAKAENAVQWIECWVLAHVDADCLREVILVAGGW